ncbi:MAG: flagellar basal body-associated FliL family protein [Syntrophorhabdaceae bacterium]|nr:flagellar basal body-associated FliL family protein [Syntrophorhabdaceae bacterium]
MPEDNVKKEKEAQESKKKKGKFKLIILILLFVICLGAVGVYFMYGNKIMGMLSGRTAQEGQKEIQKKTEKPTGPILSLEPFLFNIAGTSSKYAKISIGIQLKDNKVLEEAKKITPIMRDKILTSLGSKSIEVLMDVGSRDMIRQELYNTLKGLFQKESDLTAIYITDIMIQ